MPWPFSGKSATLLNSETVESSSSPHTRFSFRLFRELLRKDDCTNVFLSPPSVMLCLALAHELASGETRQSMSKGLEIAGLDHVGIELEIAQQKSAFGSRAEAELSFANALFFGRHAQIDAPLEGRLRSLYDAELCSLDFSSPEAAVTINAWVAAKTRGKIPEIVRQISPLSALVALNAVYFKSRWLRPFQKELTQQRPFRTATGAVKQVPMMLQGGTYHYYEDQDLQIAALPYHGNLSAYILLPAVNADLRGFRQSVASGIWESWLARLRLMPGTIHLPRFRVDYDAELNTALKALGMERAFDPTLAEFEHVQTDRPPIWLDRVVHRAVAEVNEEGTEAAAATAVVFCAMAAKPKPQKRFEMIVDHPFVLVICDKSTSAILFMGWIGDPQ